ncbi:MAG: FeoB-associated Cys-rich membrane protein [Clostridiales bacterium]|nr:FeoB-associated Cys-rich membrane protein [Clostridiales bacterium]
MKLLEILLVIVVAACVLIALTVIIVRKIKKRGGCCDCTHCSGACTCCGAHEESKPREERRA